MGACQTGPVLEKDRIDVVDRHSQIKLVVGYVFPVPLYDTGL